MKKFKKELDFNYGDNVKSQITTECVLCGAILIMASGSICAKCWRCTAKMCKPPSFELMKEKSDKPRGWAFMAMYVDKNGEVYEKGILNTKLKGKYPPTEIKESITPKSKLDNNKLKEEKEKELANEYKKKKELQKLEKNEIKTISSVNKKGLEKKNKKDKKDKKSKKNVNIKKSSNSYRHDTIEDNGYFG